MTNSEHFEKNHISFAKAMEIFNEQKSKKGGTKSFDKFLASKRIELKFKTGDLIVLQLNEETRADNWKHNVVFGVIDIDYVENYYVVKCLTPNGSEGLHVGMVVNFPIAYADRNCILY